MLTLVPQGDGSSGPARGLLEAALPPRRHLLQGQEEQQRQEHRGQQRQEEECQEGRLGQEAQGGQFFLLSYQTGVAGTVLQTPSLHE